MTYEAFVLEKIEKISKLPVFLPSRTPLTPPFGSNEDSTPRARVKVTHQATTTRVRVKAEN
eukprot:1084491-Amorphochlora_amoeboformis.AAC.1